MKLLLAVVLVFLIAVTSISAWEWTKSNSSTFFKDSIPEPIDISTARECLRSSRGKFTNYCNFTIAFTWCFHIGGTDPEAWKSWINGNNSCNRGVHRNSAPIAPNEIFIFPRTNIPKSRNGKWEAGLKFIKAVRFP